MNAFEATAMVDESGAFAGFALYERYGQLLYIGTEDRLTEVAVGDSSFLTLATTGRVFVESAAGLRGVRAGEVRGLPGYPDLDNYSMPGRIEGTRIWIEGGLGIEGDPDQPVALGPLVRSPSYFGASHGPPVLDPQAVDEPVPLLWAVHLTTSVGWEYDVTIELDHPGVWLYKDITTSPPGRALLRVVTTGALIVVAEDTIVGRHAPPLETSSAATAVFPLELEADLPDVMKDAAGPCWIGSVERNEDRSAVYCPLVGGDFTYLDELEEDVNRALVFINNDAPFSHLEVVVGTDGILDCTIQLRLAGKRLSPTTRLAPSSHSPNLDRSREFGARLGPSWWSRLVGHRSSGDRPRWPPRRGCDLAARPLRGRHRQMWRV